MKELRKSYRIWFTLEPDLLDLMISLEASLETPLFCNPALRPLMLPTLKFYFGQGDEFLPLDYLRGQ